jgi:DNA uptake protein ComE-like DNA-binding protein
VRQVNINTAPASELASLRGIGVGRAARIIAARPFTITEDIVRRGIMPKRGYWQIAEQLEVADGAEHAPRIPHA